MQNTITPSPYPFQQFPKEILFQVFSYIPPEERFLLRQVNTGFKEFVEKQCRIYPFKIKSNDHPFIACK